MARARNKNKKPPAAGADNTPADEVDTGGDGMVPVEAEAPAPSTAGPALDPSANALAPTVDVVPYHNHFDDADGRIHELSERNNNLMTLKLVFVSCVYPGVELPKGSIALSVPKMCTVEHLKREICRRSGNRGLYPSCQRLRVLYTDNALNDRDEAGRERTLLSHGVSDGSYIALHIVEGDRHEPLRPIPVPTAEEEEEKEEEAAPRAEQAAAAGPSAAPAVGAQALLPSSPSSSGKLSGRKRKDWSLAETEALVSGIEECGVSWARLSRDASRRELMGNRGDVQLKDKWRNLAQAALRGWKHLRGGDLPSELKDRIVELRKKYPAIPCVINPKRAKVAAENDGGNQTGDDDDPVIVN